MDVLSRAARAAARVVDALVTQTQPVPAQPSPPPLPIARATEKLARMRADAKKKRESVLNFLAEARAAKARKKAGAAEATSKEGLEASGSVPSENSDGVEASGPPTHVRNITSARAHPVAIQPEAESVPPLLENLFPRND